jgi:hypothetical protein
MLGTPQPPAAGIAGCYTYTTGGGHCPGEYGLSAYPAGLS